MNILFDDQGQSHKILQQNVTFIQKLPLGRGGYSGRQKKLKVPLTNSYGLPRGGLKGRVIRINYHLLQYFNVDQFVKRRKT